MFFDWGPGCDTPADSYSFLQVQLYKAMLSCESVARLVGQNEKADGYACIAAGTLADVQENFWLKEAGAFTYGIKDGVPDGLILRQPNIMAAFYGVADEGQRKSILEKVLLNDKVPALQTPYMRFYENSVLCEAGLHGVVLETIKSYWGGMLDLGATTFWELYIPSEKDEQHYAMYGNKYGRSLCHAWGASPLWLFGRYFFGLQPAEEGYGKYRLMPCALKELGDFEAVLPLKTGDIKITWKKGRFSIFCAGTDGELEYGGKKYNIPRGKRTSI